jgi:hypothetical protein
VSRLLRLISLALLLSLLLTSVGTGVARADPGWYDSNWQYRMKLTFDNTASSENLTSFVVLVHLTSTHSDFWAHISSSISTDDTKDLRFLDADDSTELYFEAEKIDYASEDALIWVKVPQIDSGSNTDFIYIYYGNPAATQSAYHSANDVWDSNFKMVQHLEETSGSIINDSTTNNNDGTPQNGVTLDAAGRIDGADTFDGTDDFTDLGTSLSLNFADGTPFTVEGWYNTTEQYGTLFSFRNSTSGGALIDVCVGYDGAVNIAEKLMTIVRQDGGGGGYARVTGPTVNDGTWHYFVLTRDTGSVIELFSDGVSQGTGSGSESGGAITTNLRALGCERKWVQDSYGNADQRYLIGTIDEVRVSNVQRSSPWIEAQYLSMTDSFITYSAEEAMTPDISNTPSSHDFSAVAEGVSPETGLTNFSVTNNSGFAINITISGTDMTGGITWALADDGSPGTNIYGLKAGLEGGDYTITVKKNAPHSTLVSGLAGLATQKWGLKLYVPTSFSDGVQKTGTVTLTATVA